MSALALEFAKRGVHTLPAFTGAGFLVIYAVTSDHRVVGRRILRPGVDAEQAERELMAILDERDPVPRLQLVKDDPDRRSPFDPDDPEVGKALLAAIRYRYERWP